jgi:NAD-dependent dihydropyrimidine dehydrogenase PreA subunit
VRYHAEKSHPFLPPGNSLRLSQTLASVSKQIPINPELNSRHTRLGFPVRQFFTLSSNALRELLAQVFGSVLQKTFAIQPEHRKAFMKFDDCWYCLACVVDCPTNAITVKIPFLVR